MSDYPLLYRSDSEPQFDDIDEARRHLRHRLALAYRVFGALRWGSLGDGHISARDPGRPDSFWLIRYGVPFGMCTVDDLVLVGPRGDVIEGEGDINITAYHIHGPIHDARPEITAAVHTHTPFGTPWSATGRPFVPISQEATAFFEDHEVFEDEEVQVMSVEGGKRIAATLDDAKAIILRNHGLLTVGRSIDEAVGWFLIMERVAETHIKAGDRAHEISAEGARRARTEIGDVANAWSAFQFAVRTYVPDPTVVG